MNRQKLRGAQTSMDYASLGSAKFRKGDQVMKQADNESGVMGKKPKYIIQARAVTQMGNMSAELSSKLTKDSPSSLPKLKPLSSKRDAYHDGIGTSVREKKNYFGQK